jgi:hypothetical protein
MLRQGDALVFKKYSRRKSAQDCSQEPYFPKGAFSDDSRSDQFKAEWYPVPQKCRSAPLDSGPRKQVVCC